MLSDHQVCKGPVFEPGNIVYSFNLLILRAKQLVFL